LVQSRGRITSRKAGSGDTLLTIEAAADLGEPLTLGESVAVSGACLTVEKVLNPRVFSAYASKETLKMTTLGRKDVVNLERALKLSDRLGGHLVSGHVDGLGLLEKVTPVGRSLALVFSFPAPLAPFIVPKGSIAVDGVSLTVNEADLSRFSVNIIPQTASATTLSEARPGEEVNLETDILGRHVKRLLETGKIAPGSEEEARRTLTIDYLTKMGY
jgi:riboflavin synthase